MKLFAYIRQVWSEAREQKRLAKQEVAEQERLFHLYGPSRKPFEENVNLPPTEAEVWNHAIDEVLDKLQSNWWTIEEIRGMRR